jgi:hypothetical protein
VASLLLMATAEHNLGVQIAALAKAAECSRQTVRRALRGQPVRGVSRRRILAAARLLGVDLVLPKVAPAGGEP